MTGDVGDRPVRVLIVEDDYRVRTALRSFFTASDGFEVIGDTASAVAALELARQRAPCVVLVDVFLPRARDGLDLLRTLAEELRIPAVAISIHGWVRASALAAGANRFLDKDSAPELLLAALRSVARRQQPPDGA